MKTWIIVSISFGLLILLMGSIALVNAFSYNSDVQESTDQTIQATGSSTCTGCPGGNAGGCTGTNNCGLATCGAVSGTGSCGCGK
jgi:hypothetical protein